MADVAPNAANQYPPSSWIRVLVFFGAYWAAGWLAFIMSPGGSVQTFSSELQCILLYPLSAPGFAIGGIAHSAILFFIAGAALYVGAIVHASIFFTTKSVENWWALCAALIGGLVLAILGGSGFANNLHGWT